MNTLIELYDERAIENVLGPEMFRPSRIIYLCPPDVAEDPRSKQNLKDFFASRGLKVRIEFVECSLFKADHILRQLREIAGKYPDCMVDVTGGTDAALFAAGMFCQESGTPAFTYSRKRNQFYNIIGAENIDGLLCTLEYKVEDFFRMTGGKMRKGRVDNRILGSYMKYFDDFFRVFLRHRRKWPDDITFIQRISKCPRDTAVPLDVSGSLIQKGEHGSRIRADLELLKDLEQIGWLQNVETGGEEELSFSFADEQIRIWLRDQGSVLELYMYKVCVDAGIFGDVISSAIVDWDGTVSHESTSNEIDVMAVRGVIPVFISCKTCEVKTEALNELAILRDRFGGKGAKAVIVTTENCNAAARHRAAQLGIAVIDLEELQDERAVERIRIIMKADGSCFYSRV